MTIPRLFRIARQRLRSLSRARKLDAELDAELAFHLDALTREKAAEGLSVADARLAARREFGNVALLAEHSRDERGWTWLADLRQDVRYGVRVLRRSPALTAIAIGSLAIGIGANAAVAAAIDAVLVQPLPFATSDRLVIIQTYRFDSPDQKSGSSLPDYYAWRERSRTLEAFGASLSGPRDFGADADGAPADRISGQAFTPDLFATLGVHARLGHLFEETDNPYSKSALVIVLSDRLWRSRFGGATDVIGRTIEVGGAPRTIIGIMPPDFRFQSDSVQYWIPIILVGRPGVETATAARVYGVTARLRPGATIEQAQADLDAIAAQLAEEAPDSHRGWGARVEPLRHAMYGWTRPRLLTIAASVGLVLLIACANVSGLLLSRASVRQREIAMRVALGASRARIVRQLLTESILLAVAGGAVGVFVAWAGLAGLTAALGPPPGAPGIGVMTLDLRVLGVTGLLSAATVLAFGLVPALAGSKLELTRVLNASAATSGTHPARHRQRAVLVAAQIALAEMLLIGAALLAASFVRLNSRELNFDPRGLLTFDYGLPAGQFAKPLGSDRGQGTFAVNASAAQTIQQVYEHLRDLHEAESVAGISYPPVNSLILPTMSVRLADRAAAPSGGEAFAAYFLVTPNLFATLKTPIVRGRDIDARDRNSMPWVAVINEAMARSCWPGEDAIGKRFTLDAGPDEQSREVVGIVRDVPTRLGQTPAQPVIYASILQQPARFTGRWVGMFGSITFVIRPSGDAMGLLAAARRAVAEVTPNRPIVDVGTVDAHIHALVGESRNYVVALGSFAATSTLLAVIGIYGVMAYAVNERTREIGIRKTLGAGAREIAAMVGRRALWIVGLGLTVGLAGSLALTRLIASQLWGIAPTDPATFAAVVILLACAAALACLVPLRRAVAVDPAVTLRLD